MREEKIITAGFGGQGVLTAGDSLAYAGIEAGLCVTLVPSYGPEMRGGIAKCSVILSDEEIGCPIIERPNTLIVMNQPSLNAYLSWIVPGGLVIINKSMVKVPATARSDVEFLYIDANVIAQKLGNARVANTVMIGAYCKRGFLSWDALVQGVEKVLTVGGKERFIPLNLQALKAGRRAAGILEMKKV